MPPKAEDLLPQVCETRSRDCCYRITYVLGLPRPASYADFLSDCRSVFMIDGICANSAFGGQPARI